MTTDIENRVREAQFLQACLREDGVFVTEVAIRAADRDALLRCIARLESAVRSERALIPAALSD
jgi:hypothetical protein